MAPRLAVCIVSWNVKELLDRCLLSLREETARAGVDATTWVVDNASHDGSAAMVRHRHPWAHVDALDVNLGFVKGNNRILERLRQTGMPDYVWLLNPDTEVRPGALSILLNFMESRPRAGLAGPQLLNPDGSCQPGAFRFPGLLQPLFDLGLLPARLYNGRLNGRYPPTLYAQKRPFRVDHPLGAAMLARGEALNQVGPLDEQFFMYCEEVDWAWRMHEAGWEVWLVPAAEVIHHGGASTGQARPATTAHLWESRARLYAKHRPGWTRALVAAAVRGVFRRKPAPSPEWESAHERIVAAWSSEEREAC